jgi:hypothetical protein
MMAILVNVGAYNMHHTRIELLDIGSNSKNPTENEKKFKYIYTPACFGEMDGNAYFLCWKRIIHLALKNVYAIDAARV